MFSFLRVQVEKVIDSIQATVKLDVKALNNNSFKLESVKEKIEAENVIGKIEHTTHVEQQLVIVAQDLNGLPVGLTPDDVRNLIQRAKNPLPPSASTDSTGAQLPSPRNDEAMSLGQQLQNYVAEHKTNPSFLLTEGQLLFFYEKRSEIDFSEDSLILLLKSSVKSNFPFWYWCFLYREKSQSQNVVPLIKAAYSTDDVKIRIELIKVLCRFTDTAGDVIELAETEKSNRVLGSMITALSKAKNDEGAHRILQNALSRRIIPRLELSEIKTLTVDITSTERLLLKEIINDGWPEQKVFALNILSTAPHLGDLPAVEEVIEKQYYSRALESALHCVARIGKTNRPELIKKLIEDTRQGYVFLQALETTAAIKDKSFFEVLFPILKKPESVLWRFSDLNTYSYHSKLDEAATASFDEVGYEVVIKDILSDEFFGKDWGTYTWRQLFFLKSIEDTTVVSLIKKETRLSNLPEWSELIEEKRKNELLVGATVEKLVEQLQDADLDVVEKAMKSLVSKQSPEELLSYEVYISAIEARLKTRASELKDKSNTTAALKELLGNGLENMIGDNGLCNESLRSVKIHTDVEEEKQFLKEVSKFDSINGHYFRSVLKGRTQIIYDFLIKHIGLPYDEIYSAITLDWPMLDKAQIAERLEKLIKESPNGIFKLRVIDACLEIGVLEKEELHLEVLTILYPARERLKKD